MSPAVSDRQRRSQFVDRLIEEALDLHRKRRVPIPLRLVARTGDADRHRHRAAASALDDHAAHQLHGCAVYVDLGRGGHGAVGPVPPARPSRGWASGCILLLMQVGGLGFLVATGADRAPVGTPGVAHGSAGRQLLAGLASTQAILQVLGRTVAFMLAVEGVGTLILWVHWRLSGIVPAGDAAFYALFHAVAAFCNAGFDLFGGLPQYPGRPSGRPDHAADAGLAGDHRRAGHSGVYGAAAPPGVRRRKAAGRRAEPADAGAVVGAHSGPGRVGRAADQRVPASRGLVGLAVGENGCCGRGFSRWPRARPAFPASAISLTCTRPAACCCV